MSNAEGYPDEEGFYAAWHLACASSSQAAPVDETELALRGGALADRLAWVFVSGYQAAVRRCFPEFAAPSGWTCLAAAEAGDGPGCRLDSGPDGLRLSGDKSWIAGAGVLDSLVVSVGTTVTGIFLATSAGYAFSRFRFPGHRAGMAGFLVTQMFPGTMMIVPLYLIINALEHNRDNIHCLKDCPDF